MQFFTLRLKQPAGGYPAGSSIIPYAYVWAFQKEWLEKRVRDEVPDTFLFVEHPATITRGRGLQRSAGKDESLRSVPLGKVSEGTEYFEIERGGDLTWHGPGQLVIYPIVKLDGQDFGPNRDVTGFLRKLEMGVGSWLSKLGLQPEYREGSTGIWIAGGNAVKTDQKVASIGIAVRKWVTYHGIGINLTNSLDGFREISPCGFSPDVMTSVAKLGITLEDRQAAEKGIAAALAGQESLVSLLEV